MQDSTAQLLDRIAAAGPVTDEQIWRDYERASRRYRGMSLHTLEREAREPQDDIDRQALAHALAARAAKRTRVLRLARARQVVRPQARPRTSHRTRPAAAEPGGDDDPDGSPPRRLIYRLADQLASLRAEVSL